jgi:dienelactone hydrolase
MQKLIPTKQQAEQKTLIDKAADTASIGVTMGPWLIKHREAVSLPLIQKFVSHLRSDPSHKKIGAVGFCWGGRYAILLAHEGADPYVDAAVALHPSFLSMPDEIEKIGKPVSIEVGDSDDIMKMPDVEKTKEIFKNKPQCEIEVYEDQVHGFSVRGDLSIEKDRKAKEKAAERVRYLKRSKLILIDHEISQQAPVIELFFILSEISKLGRESLPNCYEKHLKQCGALN